MKREFLEGLDTVAHAILGEVTPAMATAVGGCRAKKYLVPMNSCGVVVAGVREMPLGAYVTATVEQMAAALEGNRATPLGNPDRPAPEPV